MEEITEAPKINGIEGAVMVGVCILFDVADFFATFLDALFGAGELVKFFINAFASVVLWLWATMKGVGAERTLVGNLLEFVPIINTLPIRTIAMLATIWLDRHPKQAELAENLAPKIKNPRRAIGRRALAAKAAKTTQVA